MGWVEPSDGRVHPTLAAKLKRLLLSSEPVPRALGQPGYPSGFKRFWRSTCGAEQPQHTRATFGVGARFDPGAGDDIADFQIRAPKHAEPV
jgi:hypothetical protein